MTIPEYYAPYLRSRFKGPVTAKEIETRTTLNKRYADGLLVPKHFSTWIEAELNNLAKDMANLVGQKLQVDMSTCGHFHAQSNPCFERVPCPDCGELVKR